VVEKIVEFFGPGVSSLSVADRATIANMAPNMERRAPFSDRRPNARLLELVALGGETSIVEAYARAQASGISPISTAVFTDIVTVDLSTVETTLAARSGRRTRSRSMRSVPVF